MGKSVTKVLSSETLPTADDATSNSFAEQHNATCLANTRTDLLHQIQECFGSPAGELIFWLNGMAGTGKSTIARTIAKWLREVEDGSIRLNTGFFFKKSDRDRGHARLFFANIASQLKTLDSDLGSLIASTINADPSIKNKALREQFDKLIMQPLRAVQKSIIITIVIDAMDECDECDDAKLIIDLLLRLREIPSVTIRVFLTSRPELPIRLVFKDLTCKDLTCKYREISLHDIPDSVIEQDLMTFFIHTLGKIRDKQNKIPLRDDQLQPDWPGPENIRHLVGMASPLFIFASTVCRFINCNSISPEKQLLKILEYQHTVPLEAVYAPILNQLLNDVTEEDQLGVVEDFEDVVGSVVSLQEPLSANSLSALLGVPRPDIDQILRQLHSVLAVPSDPDAPIEVLHKSFSDYLFSKGEGENKPHQFRVDSGESHERIASHCMRILSSLRQDLCRLNSLGQAFQDISPEVLDQYLPHHESSMDPKTASMGR
ncbi:unnamed protein product [Clonostachys chloroleuca]|uniref:NACHT domain-containing protein n=1 Tax=Clonostachys chloroleuca TaxID=1926264 RepID=A0AA35PWR1_9HYPO|nr:unnamed protein product [Clonostachys chloroleuca]